MYVLINIVIGAIGSIVATIVLFLLTKAYRFEYKDRISYSLDMANNYIWQIENHLTFPDDYNIVVHCAEKLHRCLFEIHENLYPLSMWRCKRGKRLVHTLLYDAIRRCEYIFFVTVGYNGNEEKEARIRKIEKRLYASAVSPENSIVKLELDIIKELIERQRIQDALKTVSTVDFDELIDINSFKNTGYNTVVQKSGLTRQEYVKIIENK